MTSDTTPRGEAFGLTPASGNQAYKAFDNNSSTFYAETNLSSGSGAYVGYDFKKLVNIKKIDVIYYNLPSTAVAKVQYYNSDNDTWVDASDELTILANGVLQSFNINTDAKSTKWRLYKVSSAYSGGDRFPICTLQFYSSQESECITENQSAMSLIGLNNYCANTLLADADWLEGICNSTYFESVLNVKVPTMTSNTTPSGEVIAIPIRSGYETAAFRVYDGDNSSWGSSGNGNADVGKRFVLGYHFTSQVSIRKATLFNSNSGYFGRTFKLAYSDDGVTWFESDESVLLDSAIVYSLNFADYGEHTYWGMSDVTQGIGYSILYEAQMYGRADV